MYCENLIFVVAADASQSLPFIELGSNVGVDAVSLPAQNDGVSGAITVPAGFVFANTSQTAAYVRYNYYYCNIITDTQHKIM